MQNTIYFNEASEGLNVAGILLVQIPFLVQNLGICRIKLNIAPGSEVDFDDVRLTD